MRVYIRGEVLTREDDVIIRGGGGVTRVDDPRGMVVSCEWLQLWEIHRQFHPVVRESNIVFTVELL